MGTEPTGEVHMHNWHTAFAIPLKDVNRVIRAKGRSARSFADEYRGRKVEGAFGDWQLLPSGNGKSIHISTPIPEVTLTVPDGTVFRVTDASAVVQVELEFVPHEDQPEDESEGTFHNLVVKSTPASADVRVADVLAFLAPPDQHVDDEVKRVFKTGLDHWFNAHLSEFDHVFSTVNLNRKAAEGQWEWLCPTTVGYACVSRDTEEDSQLGILCMTQGVEPTGTEDELSPYAVPPGAEAGFLISPERLMTCLLIPQLATAYPNSTAKDYKLLDDKLGVESVRDIPLKTVTHAGTDYHPVMKEFKFWINGTDFELSSYTETPISPGITAWCRSTRYYTIELGKNSKGEQTLLWKESRPGVDTHDAKIADWVKKVEEITLIVTIIIGLIIAAATEGAAMVICLVVSAILAPVLSEVATMIADVHRNDAPAIDAFALNATDPIKWPDSRDFTLTHAGVNSSLQLGGDPQFAT